jgi:hypothetical protein
MTKNLKRLQNGLLAGLFLFVFLAAAILPARVEAAQLTARKVTLGSSAVSAVTTHQFNFTTATTASIGSVGFLYCTTAAGACTKPTGLTTTSATLDAQSGVGGAFTLNNTTDGAPYVTRTSASLASGATASFTLGAITNPSTTNTTFYVRVTSYTGTNGSTGPTDTGTVAASTANQITVTASVDETLTFCVYTGVNCAASGSSVALGSLSASSITGGVSKMDAGTNATSGYVIQYVGPTLTSGANTITAIGGTATTSTPGSPQFGINATGPNTSVTGSAAPSGGSGTASTNYSTANSYAFVASSLTQIASAAGPTDATTYTVSYIANIGASQAAGSYTTTITYICTATF